MSYSGISAIYSFVSECSIFTNQVIVPDTFSPLSDNLLDMGHLFKCVYVKCKHVARRLPMVQAIVRISAQYLGRETLLNERGKM